MKVVALFSLILMSSTVLADSFFDATAKGIVACYEDVGERLPKFYDEEGVCGRGELHETSIWIRKSRNDSIVTRSRTVRSDGERRSWYRVYRGTVKFRNARGEDCSFELTATSTDEESAAEVRDFECEEFGLTERDIQAIEATLGKYFDERWSDALDNCEDPKLRVDVVSLPHENDANVVGARMSYRCSGTIKWNEFESCDLSYQENRRNVRRFEIEYCDI